MKNNKTKKIIIGIILTIVLICISVIVYFYLNKKEEVSNIVEENIKYTYTDNGPKFFCSDKILGNPQSSYDVGEDVYCVISFELIGSKPGIKEIWAEYSVDEDIEYVKTINTSKSGWILKETDNKFNLTTTKPTVYAEYFYQIHFKIKPSTNKEKLEITFKNIRYKDAKNDYYKTDDSKIELSLMKQTKYKYEESKNNDSISFYKFNKTKGYELINKYNCKDENCHLLVAQCFGYIDLENGITFIVDNNRALMYDFNVGIIGEYDTSISSLYEVGEEYNIKYFVAKDMKTNKYGIIDLKGNIVKEFQTEGYGINNFCELYTDSYSIKDNLIVEKKGNKYGITKITKDELIVEHKYDEIRIYNNKYYKAKENGLWHLYSFENNEKISNEGYKELFIVGDNITVTRIGDYLYIKDYQGNNIIEEKIEVFMDYDEDACCGGNPGITVYKENDIIRIITYKETYKDYGYDSYMYEFNIKTNKLTKKDSAN